MSDLYNTVEPPSSQETVVISPGSRKAIPEPTLDHIDKRAMVHRVGAALRVPPSITLPKIVTIAPQTRKRQFPQTTATTVKSPDQLMPTPSSSYISASAIKKSLLTLTDTPDTVSQEPAQECNLDVPAETTSPLKILMKGRPVVVNGESGVFVANKMLESSNVNIVVQSSPSAHSTSMYSNVISKLPLLPNMPRKSKRTVGVSTDPNVPMEIGIFHVGASPGSSMRLPVVECINMELQADNTVRFVKKPIKTSETSSQTTDEDFYDFNAFREKYLPKSDKYKYNYTTVEIQDDSSLIEFRVAGVTTKPAVADWVRQAEALSNTHYRVWKTFKPKKEGAYKIDLRCHMNQGKTRKTMKGKDFGCRSVMSIRIDPPTFSRGVANRILRERFRCKVRYRFTHNHTAEESLKHLSVRKEVREKILKFYEEDMSVSDAYTKYYQELKNEYGAGYYAIVCDRSLCPDKGYFYNVWKVYSTQTYGKVVKPPRPSIPKVPWNKGLRGITSLKQFFPWEDQSFGAKKKKGEPGKKERIRRAALEGVESTLMESIRQNPEAYSKAVACFVEVWKVMDDKERLTWLQTKIEGDVAERVALFTADQLDENVQAADNIHFEEFAAEHSYSDVMTSQHSIAAHQQADTVVTSQHANSIVLAPDTDSIILQENSDMIRQHTNGMILQQNTDGIVLPQHTSAIVLPQHTDSMVLPQHSDGMVLPQHTDGMVLPQHADGMALPQHTDTIGLPHDTDGIVLSQQTESMALPQHTDSVVLSQSTDGMMLSHDTNIAHPTLTVATSPTKMMKLTQTSTSQTVTEFTFQLSERGLPYYRVATNHT